MKFELVGSFVVFALLYTRYKQLSMAMVLPVVLLLSYVALHLIPFDLNTLHDLTWLDILENNFEILSFLAGMLLFFKFRQLGQPLAFGCLVAGLYCAGVHDNSIYYAWLNPWLDGRTYNILNFIAGPLIVTPILTNQTLAHTFSMRIPVYLGRVSFAAYLNHLLVLYIIGLPFFNYLHQYWPTSYAPTALLTCVMVIAITLLFSELYYRLVDQQAMRLSSWLTTMMFNKG